MARALNTSSKFQIYLDGDKFWELLENGKDTNELYPDHFKSEITDKQHHAFMVPKLLPGEEYVLLDNIAYDYALTSFGRIFNCIYGTQVKTYFLKDDVMVSIRTYKSKMSKMFAQYDWEFDYKKLKTLYKKNKWTFLR
jgi:hypothetical protein